jgi:hypothetical protein
MPLGTGLPGGFGNYTADELAMGGLWYKFWSSFAATGAMAQQPGAPAWWCADGLVVGGRSVTVLWDADGSRYGRGAGLSVLLEGALAAHSADAQGELRVPLG